MSYTQSFNESMTKDDREDAERRMATVRPVTAGIASKAVINAQSNMTKDDREDAERRLAYAKSVTATVVQSGMTKDDREDAERRMAYVKPVTAGIASNAVIQAQSNKSKEDREISNAYKTPGYVQPVYASQVRPQASNTSTSTGMTRMTASPVIIPGTKDAREAAAAAAAAGTDWVKLALQVGMAYLLLA